MNALSLAQTSPASNPDRNLVQVTVSGAYVHGTADPLPLDDISDPGALSQVPFDPQRLVVTPSVYNAWCAGYYAQVERTVADGVSSFGLRWFESEGTELGSDPYPAAITGGEIFLEVLCPVTEQ